MEPHSRAIRQPVYRLARRFHEGAHRTFVQVDCARCGKTTEISWHGATEPNLIFRKFSGMGWDFDPFKPRGCVCPICRGEAGVTTVVRDQLRRELAHHPMGKTLYGSAREMRALKTDELKAALAAAELALIEAKKTAAKPPVEKPLAVKEYVTEVKEEPPMAAEVLNMTAVKPRALTAGERSSVRKLLDQHFMDDEGRYIDNYSDQRIGEEVGVPWALVASMRETAYGPLKADPKIDQLRRELLDLRERVARAEKAMADVVADVTDRIVSAENTLAKIDL